MHSNGGQGNLRALKSGGAMSDCHVSPAMLLAKALVMGTLVWVIDVSF